MKKFSTRGKVAIISIITIILVTAVGIFALKKLEKNEIQAVSANGKNLSIEEEVVPVIKEEVIHVSQDNTIDESLLQNGEDENEVEVGGKKIAVPKSKVAPVNSAEDPENNKKKGGEEMNQSQVNSMFENVGTKSFGIDVSAHQGKINWAAVKAEGIDFAMIRCGFRGYGTGSINEDAYFKTNVAGANANGIKVGIYFYSAAINEQEALEEAVWVISKIKTYRITYPVVYDFEDYQRHRCANVDGAQATRNANTFLNLIKQAGYEPMMYANKSDLTSRISRGAFNCKMWLAHYTNQTDYSGSYQMWQFTSKGTVNGINGYVDRNIAYFSYGATAAPKHTHDFSEVVKNSLKQATCTQEGSKTLRCSCGDTQVEKIPKIAHKFGSWETTKPATVEEEGLKVRKCQNCSTQETQKIEKLKPSTNNNTSTNTNTNTNTGDTNTTEKPHTHSFTIEIPEKRVEPKCGVAGSKTMKCTGCDKTENVTIPALEHKFGEWIIDEDSTTEKEGSKHKECENCGEKGSITVIPKKETELVNKVE